MGGTVGRLEGVKSGTIREDERDTKKIRWDEIQVLQPV